MIRSADLRPGDVLQWHAGNRVLLTGRVDQGWNGIELVGADDLGPRWWLPDHSVERSGPDRIWWLDSSVERSADA